MGRKDSVKLDSVIQGCKNSPTVFENQSACEPKFWVPPSQSRNLLQYMDATVTKEDCVERTASVLNFLGLNAYQGSQQKAQLTKENLEQNGRKQFAKCPEH